MDFDISGALASMDDQPYDGVTVENKVIFIDVQDIYGIVGAPMVFGDVLRTVGGLQNIYVRYLHPLLMEVVNSDQFAIQGCLKDPKLAEHTYESISSKALLNGIRSVDDVNRLVEVVGAMFELMIPDIYCLLNSIETPVADNELTPTGVYLLESVGVQLLPNEVDANLVRVTIDYAYQY